MQFGSSIWSQRAGLVVIRIEEFVNNSEIPVSPTHIVVTDVDIETASEFCFEMDAFLEPRRCRLKYAIGVFPTAH